MKRSMAALSAALLLVTIGSTACSTRHQPAAVDESSSAPANTTSIGPSAPKKHTGRIGDKLDLTRADGGTFAVTVTRIIDPATVSGEAADPDKNYLATELSITNTGTADIDGDININVSVVGSDNQTYPPDLHDVTECTNFEAGVFVVAPDKTATGCAAFALPHGVTVTKVKYQPSAGFANDYGEWLVR